MKNCKVTFLPISGSGTFHLDFLPGPFGDAVEATLGDEVGFFSSTGALQGVTFDDVNENKDHQFLKFDRFKIDVAVNKRKVTYSVTELKDTTKPLKASKSKSKGAA